MVAKVPFSPAMRRNREKSLDTRAGSAYDMPLHSRKGDPPFLSPCNAGDSCSLFNPSTLQPHFGGAAATYAAKRPLTPRSGDFTTSPPPMSSPPSCHVVAGPNGSGKSTFALRYLPQWAGDVEFVNP